MIKFENVSFSYEEKQILQNFSLTIPDSGITVLRGPSGCGKTSLLRLLSGLERPGRGTITGISPQQTAILFQENRPFPWRSVKQHLTDVMPPERHKEAEYWLRFVELEEDVNSYPDVLSGGMQRRLALGRCLALGGKLFLLDEPFAGVDPERAGRIFHRLSTLNCPVLLVSHEDSIAQLARQVIALDGPPLRII